MAKNAKQFDPTQLEGKTIKKVDVLGDGYSRLSMEDGTAAVIQVVPISMTVVTSEKASKAKAKEVEEEEDDEEDETSVEDMRAALIESGMTKKKVKGMSDEEVEEAYEELEEDEDDEDEDEDEDEDDEDEDSDDDEEEDEDDDDDEDEDDEDSEGHTAEEIDEMDFDDLEDLIDDEELEIDIEEFEDKAASVKKLKAAVKKALKIK